MFKVFNLWKSLWLTFRPSTSQDHSQSGSNKHWSPFAYSVYCVVKHLLSAGLAKKESRLYTFMNLTGTWRQILKGEKCHHMVRTAFSNGKRWLVWQRLDSHSDKLQMWYREEMCFLNCNYFLMEKFLSHYLHQTYTRMCANTNHECNIGFSPIYTQHLL